MIKLQYSTDPQISEDAYWDTYGGSPADCDINRSTYKPYGAPTYQHGPNSAVTDADPTNAINRLQDFARLESTRAAAQSGAMGIAWNSDVSGNYLTFLENPTSALTLSTAYTANQGYRGDPQPDWIF